MALLPLGRLNPESKAQRRAKARFGVADQQMVLDYGATVTALGRHKTPAGLVVVSTARQTRDFFNRSNQFLRSSISWVRADGTPIPDGQVKAAVEALYTRATAEIGGLATELGNGRLSAQQFYDALQLATKKGHGAAAALARGGVDQMTPAAWEKVAAILEQEWGGKPGVFPGARRFAEDLARGRYGKERINGLATERAQSYAHQFRTTYENARADVAEETGHDEVSFLLGASDHCPGCLERAARGPMSIEEYEANPIGGEDCGSFCKCVPVFKKSGVKWVPSVYAAQDRAKAKLEAHEQTVAEDAAAKEAA